jgi:hypothetical protein
MRIPGISDIFHAKNIQIFSEESDEHEFLFGVEHGADLELLVWIIGVCQDFLAILICHCSLLLVVRLLINGQLGGC